MKISDDRLIAPGTQAVCAVLTDAGYRALFVGGCVRNALLGEPISDIDIATDALPEIVTNLAQNAGFNVIPTGIDHGTVTVIAQGEAYEVTTFRRDVQADGRRAVVAFSTDVADDAARRDFTMNALYATPDGAVLDPLAGLPDLLARRVRFVGHAETRIREDYLRILRFFRFHAVYGDMSAGIDAEGLAACAANLEGIDRLARERIGAEMRKLLAARDPSPAIASMAQSGVLAKVLPGADSRALAILCHLEQDMPPRWQRRLAALGGADPGQSLRLSRAENVSNLAVRAEIGSTLLAAALGWKLGVLDAADVIFCRAALLEMSLPADWQAEVARGAAATFPVSAADLMPNLQGPALGVRLREIEKRWLASNLTASKGELLG